MSIKDNIEIKKGAYENDAPAEQPKQEKKPVVKKYEAETPADETQEESNAGNESAEIEIGSDVLKAVKSWEVGRDYPIKLTLIEQRIGDDGKTVIGKFRVK